MYYCPDLFGIFRFFIMGDKLVEFDEWQQKAKNFQKRISDKQYPVNLEYYKQLLSMVRVGKTVLDVGCGDCHIKRAFPKLDYYGIDPIPRPVSDINVMLFCAEELICFERVFDTTIAFASLDNCYNLQKALVGMKSVAKQNVIILTGIGIEPDELHTLRIDRKDLVEVLGEPVSEREIKPNVWLFDFDA